MMLQKLSNKVLVLSMKGYIFFGSSVLLLRDAKKALRIKETNKANAFEEESFNQSPTNNVHQKSGQKESTSRFASQSACLTPISNRGGTTPAHYVNAAHTNSSLSSNHHGSRTPGKNNNGSSRMTITSPINRHNSLGGGGGSNNVSPNKNGALNKDEMEFFAKSFQRTNSYQAVDISPPSDMSGSNHYVYGQATDGELLMKEPIKMPPLIKDEVSVDINLPETSKNEVEVAILDFSKVIGLDASAARSCFLMLKQVCVWNQ